VKRQSAGRNTHTVTMPNGWCMIVYKECLLSGNPNGNWNAAMKYAHGKKEMPSYVSEVMENTVKYIKYMKEEKEVTLVSGDSQKGADVDVNIRRLAYGGLAKGIHDATKVQRALNEKKALQEARVLDMARKLVDSKNLRQIFIDKYTITGRAELKEKNMHFEDLMKDLGLSGYKVEPTGMPVTDFDLAPKIEKVKFNDPATIVWWKDGTKTVVTCHKDDTFVPYVGLAIAHMKKRYGSQWARMHHIKKGLR